MPIYVIQKNTGFNIYDSDKKEVLEYAEDVSQLRVSLYKYGLIEVSKRIDIVCDILSNDFHIAYYSSQL